MLAVVLIVPNHVYDVIGQQYLTPRSCLFRVHKPEHQREHGQRSTELPIRVFCQER